MAYTQSGVVRDPFTRATVSKDVKVFVYRRDTGAAHSTPSVAAGANGTWSVTDLTDGVQYDFVADVGAGPHVKLEGSGVGQKQVAVPIVVTHASVASNGADAKIAGQIGPFGGNGIRVKAAWWTPTGTDQATKGTATTSASYKRLLMVNGGSAGTAVSPVIATWNLTASVASLSATAHTSIDSSATVASNEIIYFSALTVGAATADGTELRAGQFAFSYEAL
jgi:hypothetical protein